MEKHKYVESEKLEINKLNNTAKKRVSKFYS